MCVKNIIVIFLAPTAAPQNLKYSEINATTFIVTWQPLNTTNGPVTMYELIIQKQIKQRALRSTQISTTDVYEKINATCCSAILYGRSLCSVYAISIRGYSHAGPGPASKPITLLTSGKKSLADLNCNVINKETFEYRMVGKKRGLSLRVLLKDSHRCSLCFFSPTHAPIFIITTNAD